MGVFYAQKTYFFLYLGSSSRASPLHPGSVRTTASWQNNPHTTNCHSITHPPSLYFGRYCHASRRYLDTTTMGNRSPFGKKYQESTFNHRRGTKDSPLVISHKSPLGRSHQKQ